VGDPGGGILRAYKVKWPLIGVAQRVTYVVARNRKVRLAFHSELDIEAHMTKARGAPAAPEA
jgi:peroxiredoxin